MKAIVKIAYRNLIRNKKWSIPTGVAILLAVILLTGLSTIISSFVLSSRSAIINNEGPSHIVAYNVSPQQQAQLKELSSVKEMDVWPIVSYAKISNYSILNSQSPYLKLMNVSLDQVDTHVLRLMSGRYPENENEIVLNEAVHYYTDLNLVVGDVIQLDIGSRMVGDTENPDRFIDIEFERFEVNNTKQYVVSGFVTSVNTSIMDLQEAGFLSIVLDRSEKTHQNSVLIELNNPNTRNFSEVSYFLHKNQIDFTQTNLLSTFFIGLDSVIDSSLYLIVFGGGILALLIIISSILVIRNAYSINHRYMIKQLGQLDAIGATHSQKLQLLLIQSGIFIIICVPLGLLIGYMASYLILSYFSVPLSEIVFYSNLRIYLYPSLLVTVIVATVSIILFTNIFPAIHLSALSSIESIKYYEREIENSDNVVVWSFFKRIESKLAVINYRRGRKYYRSLILSVIVSIVLIGTSIMLVNTNKKTQVYSRKDITYSYQSGEIETGRLNEIVNQLKQAPQLSRSGLWDSHYVLFDEIKGDVSSGLLDQMDSSLFLFKVEVIDDDYCVGVLESEFDGFDCEQQGLFVDYVNTTTSDEQGEIIELEGPLFNDELNKLTIQIGENLYQLDFEEEYFYASSILETDPTIYYSRSTFNRLSSPFVNLIKEFKRDEVISQYQIFVNGENNNEALNVFRNILSQNGIENLQNIENIVNTNYLINQFARFIGLISFALVIMIITIAISNLINSVNHSMSMRLRETGILLSSGMTLDSFVRMIVTEVALFGFWAIIIGVPVAILITWITSNSLDLNLGSMHSQWLSMTLISLLLVVLMMLLSIILNVSTLRKYDITTLSKE